MYDSLRIALGRSLLILTLVQAYNSCRARNVLARSALLSPAFAGLGKIVSNIVFASIAERWK